MGSGVKKIAVNVVDTYDLKQAHLDIINYLYPDRQASNQDVENKRIRIDYFVCNEVTGTSVNKVSDTVSIHNTQLEGEDFQLNRIRTNDNKVTVEKFRRLLVRLYRSWLNGQVILQQAQDHIYSHVITYSPVLASHHARFAHAKGFVTELDIVSAIIYEPRWLKIDYDCFVTSMYGFNKIVNFWQFMPYVTDDTFRIWNWSELPDADKFLLPVWLGMQALKVRSNNEL
jgi:hypothetical protein